MSCRADRPAWLAAHAALRWLPNDRVLVQSDLYREWHVLDAREWTVLQLALRSPDVSSVASNSTAFLQRSVGLRERLERFDALPPVIWSIGGALSPRLRRLRERVTPVTGAEAGYLLERFERLGLLVRVPDSEPSSTCSGVTVCVLTRDNPSALRRAVARMRAHATQTDGHVSIAVYDASAERAARVRNREVCLASGTQHVRVTYFGEHERQDLGERLIRAGIATEMVRFAVCDDRTDIRNLALLTNAGRRVLLVDDDAAASSVLASSCPAGDLILSHAAVPAGRRASATGAERVSLNALHRGLLGVQFASVLSSHHPVEVVEPDAAASPSWGRLLACGGRVRGCVWPAQTVVASVRLCTRPVLGGRIIGLDSSMVPPFVASDADHGLFLECLQAVESCSLLAIMPGETEKHTVGPVAPSASVDRVLDMLVSHVVTENRTHGRTSAPEQLKALGSLLGDLAIASADDLARVIRTSRAHGVSRAMARRRRSAPSDSSAILSQPPVNPNTETLRDRIDVLGRLHRAWPEIWSTAARYAAAL